MPEGVPICVRVTPRAARNQVAGVRREDGVLLLRVCAPPVDGAANRACRDLLANLFGVGRSAVVLVGGETSRDKRFVVAGRTEADRDTLLASLPSPSGTGTIAQ